MLHLPQVDISIISKKPLSRLVCKGNGAGWMREAQELSQSQLMMPTAEAPPSSHPCASTSITLPSVPVPCPLSPASCTSARALLVSPQCFLSSYNVNYCGICLGLSPLGILTVNYIFFPFTSGQLTSINYPYHVMQVNLPSPLEIFPLAFLGSFIFALISCTIFLSLFIFLLCVCLCVCTRACYFFHSLPSTL